MCWAGSMTTSEPPQPPHPERAPEQPVAERPAYGHAEPAVLPAELLLAGPGAARLRQQPYAVDRTPARQDRLHEGDRPGVAEAAGRGDLCVTPCRAVPVSHAHGRAGSGV